jgi:hypothetical protein
VEINIRIRLATPADIPVLRALIDASVRGLQAQDYSPAQIEGALKTVFGVDTQLIVDGIYFVAEADPGAVKRAEQKNVHAEAVIAGCGGWTRVTTRRRYAPFSFIRPGHVAALGA